MKRRGRTAEGRSSRRRTFIWIFSAAAVVAALLYWEQAGVLYLLSTLAMCALLIVVAFSDLKGKDMELNESAHETVASGGGAPSSETPPTSTGVHPLKNRGESFKKARPVKRLS